MKYLLKLILSMLLCGLLILSGCGTASNSLPSELVGKSSEYPESLSILAPDFFYSENDENAENTKQQWLDEMSTRYGTKINVISNTYRNGTPDYSGSEQQQKVSMGQESFSGFVEINSFDILKLMVNKGIAIPLDYYLKDNAIWNSLPEKIKSTFEIDGHIYAIPASNSYSLYSRYIRNDAIEQTGVTITDLDTLKEFSIAYTQATGNNALNSYALYSLSDIFNAFGLYNTYNTTPFCYDPTDDSIVDFLTKGSAVAVLGYLRELYTADALSFSFDAKDYNTENNNFINGQNASIYNPDEKPDNCTELITLNLQYPQILKNNVSGFILTKDTPQLQETVNLFIDMMFGSEENYFECWLGSSHSYEINSDGSITVNMVQNSNNNYSIPAMPNLTGGLTDFIPYTDANILYSQDGIISNDSKTKAGQKNKEIAMLNEALRKGIAVKIPLAYSIIKSSTYENIRYDINALYKDCIINAITNDEVTVQNAVDDYRKTLLNMGGNNLLDEMNAAIGKKTAYYYG